MKSKPAGLRLLLLKSLVVLFIANMSEVGVMLPAVLLSLEPGHLVGDVDIFA